MPWREPGGTPFRGGPEGESRKRRFRKSGNNLISSEEMEQRFCFYVFGG